VADQPWCDLGAEIVVLRLHDSAYYRLQTTGRSIWLMLEQPRTLGELLAGLATEYTAPPAAMAEEVRPFLAQCTALGLMTLASHHA
jgi:hypothetical protein